MIIMQLRCDAMHFSLFLLDGADSHRKWHLVIIRPLIVDCVSACCCCCCLYANANALDRSPLPVMEIKLLEVEEEGKE